MAGGVGYRVFVTPACILKTERSATDTVTIYTHLAVRDNALDLYGFTNQDDADFFEELLSVSGVGPKSAMAIISVAPAQVLRKAIAHGNASELQKVYGLGKKISEKLILELKDKCAKRLGQEKTSIPTNTNAADVIDALVTLGYKAEVARTTVLSLSAKHTTVEEQIKEALRQLA